MTSSDHLSGTDRLAEAVSILKLADQQIIINLQGDEIGCPAELVNQVANALHQHPQHNITTLCQKIHNQTKIQDPNIVKVVFDKNNNALYFSRSAIPHTQPTATPHAFRHIGIYAYRVAYLKKISTTAPCQLERQESLEQLRTLYSGEKIYIEQASATQSIGIDTEKDLLYARQQIAKN